MTFSEAAFRVLGISAILGWLFYFLVQCERLPKRYNRILDPPCRSLKQPPRWDSEETE